MSILDIKNKHHLSFRHLGSRNKLTGFFLKDDIGSTDARCEQTLTLSETVVEQRHLSAAEVKTESTEDSV